MKKIPALLLMIFAAGQFSSLAAQNVVEVQKPDINKNYLTVMEEAAKLSDQNHEKAVQFFEKSMFELTGDYERFNISFFNLFIRYTRMGQIEKAMNVLLEGQKENFFYPISVDGRKFPPNVDEFTRLKGFADFLQKNNRLREEAQKNAKFKYFVRLPEGYSKDKTYPFLLVLTGGWGSHIGLSEYWKSDRLDSEFITAFTQGSICRGSFLQSYQRDNMDNIVEVYRQTIQKYPIDTARIVIGGQSAGGRRAFLILMDDLIPVKGLLTAFPGIPKDLDAAGLKKAAVQDVRIVVLTGENDFGLKKQKKAAVLFDDQNVKNRFIIYPEKGHEFPDNFSRQIDLSIDFIFKE